MIQRNISLLMEAINWNRLAADPQSFQCILLPNNPLYFICSQLDDPQHFMFINCLLTHCSSCVLDDPLLFIPMK